MTTTANTMPGLLTEMPIQRVEASRLPSTDLQNVVFGSVFTDHMFVAEFDGELWHSARITPYGNLNVSPAFSGLHYGQSIFEGMKAFRNEAGEVALFRPEAHLERLNRSAFKLSMPEIPPDMFMGGLKRLVEVDSDWVGQAAGSQLYIRPVFFATDALLGVRPSTAYTLIILLCPVNAYYREPVRVFVTDKYVRSATGGVGDVKMAGNYARTMKISREAAQQGYHVVLWLDAIKRVYVEEFSTMNAFFVIGDTVVTPALRGTILEGITRDSALILLREAGYAVEERDVSIHELLKASRRNALNEAFGTGTAAVVSPAALLHYDDQDMLLPTYETWKVAPFINQQLSDIRTGRTPDSHRWMVPVNA